MLRHVSLCAQLPSYLLIVLGCYALWTIGTDLFFFGDCPEAAKELEKVRAAGRGLGAACAPPAEGVHG
jgi:hypothetical protein